MASTELEQVILDLLHERGAGKTICPSEAAREALPNDWRSKMDPVRAAAVSLAAAGRIEILQKGVKVDPNDFRGPIRLRLTE